MAAGWRRKPRQVRDRKQAGAPVPPATVDVSARPSPRRKIWFPLATIGLVLLMLWGIPELVVRIANPQLETYRAILFDRDPNSLKLFMKDPQLHWKLRPSVKTDIFHASVRTDRNGFRGADPVPGRRVVLCLGDSTAFGHRVEEPDSFPMRLQARLNNAANSGAEWSVINAGVPGYSSFQLRLLAEKLVPRWKPKVVVVCIGNNEAWPTVRSDRQLDADRAWTSRLVAGLSTSRFFVWAAERVHPEQPQPFIAPDLKTAVPRVSRDEFADNLRAIARSARSANAKLILVSPPVNLYWQPMRAEQFPGSDQWEALCKSVRTAWSAGQRQQALELVNAALAQHPDSFVALWVKGIVLTDSGDVDGGRELLEQAIERHPFPENCKRSYRDVLAQVARDEKIPYVDVNDLFRRRAPGPTPQGLYLDWCHPTPQGHHIITDALHEAIVNDKN